MTATRTLPPQAASGGRAKWRRSRSPLVAGAVAADAVFDPQRALADGTDGLRPVVPLVCRSERDEVWDATTFTKNRDRLLEADVAREFLSRVVEQARGKGLTSDEHFGGRYAAGSLGEFEKLSTQGKPTPPPDDPGNPTVNFHGQKRSNETHESKTDPDSLLARKSGGKESKLSYSGNLLVENCNGLIRGRGSVPGERDGGTGCGAGHDGETSRHATSDGGRRQRFDTFGLVEECGQLRVTPHVAQSLERRGGSAIDGRTTRHSG